MDDTVKKDHEPEGSTGRLGSEVATVMVGHVDYYSFAELGMR